MWQKSQGTTRFAFELDRQMFDIQWHTQACACPCRTWENGGRKFRRLSSMRCCLRTQQNKSKTGITTPKGRLWSNLIFLSSLYPLALSTVSPHNLEITATCSWDSKWKLGQTSWPCPIVVFTIIVGGATVCVWKVGVYDAVSPESLGCPSGATTQYLGNLSFFFSILSLFKKEFKNGLRDCGWFAIV